MRSAVTAALPVDLERSLPISPATSSTMSPKKEGQTSPPRDFKEEPDMKRARPRANRSDKLDEDAMDNEDAMDADGNQAGSSNSDGPVRKRRKSRKGLDKKFECPEPGCGKSYSRAEHLYRHQLNHQPKQIYSCDYPDCNRTFVRLDLCNRHKDRHTAKGSALNRKDSLHHSPIADRPSYAPRTSESPEANRPGTGYKPRAGHIPYQSPKDHAGSPYTPITNTPPTGFPIGGPANGVDGYMHHEAAYGGIPAHRPSHHSPGGPPRPQLQTNVPPYGVLSPVSTQHSYHSQHNSTPQSVAYVPQQNFPPFDLPPSNFSNGPASVSRDSGQPYVPATTAEYSEHGDPQSSSDMMMLDQMSIPATQPVFGSESIMNKSPYFPMPEDFVEFLFNPQQGEGSPINQVVAPGYSSYGDYPANYSVPYMGNEAMPMGYFPPASHQVMAVNNLLEPSSPEASISEEKSQEIFDYIKDRFPENSKVPHDQQKERILDGDRNMGDHLLSRRMMQAYIGSYWLHFSDQVPILHKPTFQPDKTPPLLLLAMMTIGAACLDKTHGPEVTKAGAALSNFLARQVRWEIFQDPSFRPPAKLWVFQALLLLELYEKMYSTRELHERAHIHHATTITLMRRGRALIGKSAVDSPPREDRAGLNGSRHSSASGGAATPYEWWSNWITNEATRRAAFAAFVIDSIHATMFGHTTVMVAHEMRLPLPCEESLWKATTSAEVGRIETNLLASGNKPVSFLEGLKRTLSNQEVRTNSFGRTVLMAGLLSVTWHMNQRDLQVNVLGGGVTQSLGGRDKWRGTLNRAFDFWKTDFDKSLGGKDATADPYRYDSTKRNVVFESRTVLHSLAHMAMHVDVIDCQIFARAKRLLGRTIGQQDLNNVQRRMKDQWAPSAKARDATYYALKFLYSVLLPEDTNEAYSARDDVLLNRPWVLYFAALVVWCYGFALEGPCPSSPPPVTDREKQSGMRDYLVKYASVESPESLRTMRGINNNTALLTVLKDTFHNTRWELLHEAETLLNNCIQLNAGSYGAN